MTLKEILEATDFNNPNWNLLLPYLVNPHPDLSSDLSYSQIGLFNALKTKWQLENPEKPVQRSRIWESSRGYRFLTPWSNAVLLRILVRKFTQSLQTKEFRLKAQLDDAARSTIANIEEGFKRPTTSEYLRFLGFSQASLEEVKGDVERCLQDGFLKSVPKSGLVSLGIDLKLWNNWAKNPLNSSKILDFPLEVKGLYRSLKEVKGEELSYETFRELINKTDYLLRKLVESLEKKLSADQKGYQIEQARIKRSLKGK